MENDSGLLTRDAKSKIGWCARFITVCTFVYALVSCVLTLNVCRAIKQLRMCPGNGKAKIVCLTAGKRFLSHSMCVVKTAVLYLYSSSILTFEVCKAFCLLCLYIFILDFSDIHSDGQSGCLSFIPSSVNTTQTALCVTYNCFLLLEFSAASTDIHLTWPGIITCHFRTYLC